MPASEREEDDVPISAQVLICEAAIVDSDGRLSMLGVGSPVLPLPTPPHTIVLRLLMDPPEAVRGHAIALRLHGPDGRQVRVPVQQSGPIGPASLPNLATQPVELVQELPALVENVDDVPSWGPVVIPLVFNLPPQLPVGAGPHSWQLVVDGDAVPGSSAVFLAATIDQSAQEE